MAGPTQTVVIHQNTNLLSKGDKLVILVNFQRPNRGCYCHQSYWNQKRNNPRQRQPPNFSKMGPNFDVVLDVLIHWLVENCRHLLTMPLRFVFTIFWYVLYRLFFISLISINILRRNIFFADCSKTKFKSKTFPQFSGRYRVFIFTTNCRSGIQQLWYWKRIDFEEKIFIIINIWIYTYITSWYYGLLPIFILFCWNKSKCVYQNPLCTVRAQSCIFLMTELC